jgi:hypothetical protein
MPYVHRLGYRSAAAALALLAVGQALQCTAAVQPYRYSDQRQLCASLFTSVPWSVLGAPWWHHGVEHGLVNAHHAPWCSRVARTRPRHGPRAPYQYTVAVVVLVQEANELHYNIDPTPLYDH